MKRANGTGSIVYLGANRRNPWAVKISYQARPGFWKQKYLSYHRTAKEAQAALDDYNHNEGFVPSPDKFSTTLQEVYDIWSARKYARAGPSSVTGYKISWKRLSVLASRKMRDITVDDLQRVIDQTEAAGLSQSSVNSDYSLMRALYKAAMERDIVQKDCSSFVDIPSVPPKYEKGSFNDLQLKRIEQLAGDGCPWADTVLMLCYTGFRITEFLTLTRFSYNPEGNYLQGGSKTAAGKNRIVPVHPKIDGYLQSWLSKGGDTIICHPDGSPITAHQYRLKFFSKIMSEIGLPQATPHWCRHTLATHLHIAGADYLAIKRILGHSTGGNVTERYTHTDILFLTAELQKMA